jgi:hypothetical protein
MRLPYPLELAHNAGLPIFTAVKSPNLIAIRGPGGPGVWDGLLTLSYRDGVKSGWLTYSWPCATRPGTPFLRSPMNGAGTAILAPGHNPLSHRRGLHKGRPALVQREPVVVYRDNDRDNVVELHGQTVKGLFGINIHDIRHPNDLAGCIGVSPEHIGELLAAYDRTVAFAGPDISLTLVEG